MLTSRRNLFWLISLVNLTGIALVSAAAVQGWVTPVFRDDKTHITYLIAGVLVLALVIAWNKAIPVSLLGCNIIPNHVDNIAMARMIASEWTAIVRWLVSILTLLGLIGCVIGFGMTLASVDQSSLGNPAAGAATGVAGMFQGMSVALNTTLVGTISLIWGSLVYMLLRGGAVAMIREQFDA